MIVGCLFLLRYFSLYLSKVSRIYLKFPGTCHWGEQWLSFEWPAASPSSFSLSSPLLFCLWNLQAITTPMRTKPSNKTSSSLLLLDACAKATTLMLLSGLRSTTDAVMGDDMISWRWMLRRQPLLSSSHRSTRDLRAGGSTVTAAPAVVVPASEEGSSSFIAEVDSCFLRRLALAFAAHL